MVKFKSRYLLIETLFEDNKNHHFDTGKIAIVIKNHVENFFGDVGLGKLNKNLQVKYFNNYTNLLIIRIGKENLKIIWTVLTMINNIDGLKMKFHIISISGTIKRAEIKAKKFLENWMNNYEQIKEKEKNIKNIEEEKEE